MSPVKARSSVFRLRALSSGVLIITFLGLLSSESLFLAESRLDRRDVTDLADVVDFLLLLTALPAVDFLSVDLLLS